MSRIDFHFAYEDKLIYNSRNLMSRIDQETEYLAQIPSTIVEI